MDSIFDQIAAERLFVPDRPPGVEAPQQPPTIHPRTGEHGGTVEYGDHQDHRLPAQPPTFTQADGSTYLRVEPHHFEPFDHVDSRLIVDIGGPA